MQHQSHRHIAQRHSQPGSLMRGIAFLALAVGLLVGARTALAQSADIFHGADLKLGEKLIAEHKCAQCHASKVGGDGSAIYRPKGRINSAPYLRGMVEQCNSTLNLQMFPEEVNAVGAVLNRDHYKFK